MAGLDPAIHEDAAWIPGTSPGMTAGGLIASDRTPLLSSHAPR
jgi:hypothetical protein